MLERGDCDEPGEFLEWLERVLQAYRQKGQQMMICNKAADCAIECDTKREHPATKACPTTCKWGGTCVSVEQVEPGFMIGCLHRDDCYRPCDMKLPFAASNADVAPSCFALVEKNTEPKPPELDLEAIRAEFNRCIQLNKLPAFSLAEKHMPPMAQEIERLRNELVEAQKESRLLRSRRDHWRRTAGVNREMWLNTHDELQTAKGALTQTGIGGIYAKFDGLADAIQQMAVYLMEQEKLASEYIGVVGKVADIVDAPEMWPLDGLHLVTDKVRKTNTALVTMEAMRDEALCQRNDYRRLYEFLLRKQQKEESNV